MKNPYTILDVPQDADNSKIMKAMVTAIKRKEFSTHDIGEAKNQLCNPAKRLAADFTFPIFKDLDGLQPIVQTVVSNGTDVNSLDINKYDSL